MFSKNFPEGINNVNNNAFSEHNRLCCFNGSAFLQPANIPFSNNTSPYEYQLLTKGSISWGMAWLDERIILVLDCKGDMRVINNDILLNKKSQAYPKSLLKVKVVY